MTIEVSVCIRENYDRVVENEVSTTIPGEGVKGASKVKELLTKFVQDASDILIPQTIEDLNAYSEKVEQELLNATAETEQSKETPSPTIADSDE